MERAAVIVNEFGAVGIDRDLVVASSDTVLELDNGCLCCGVRGDLVNTLFGLYADRANGTVPYFTRVIIETSGLADPAPIMQTLLGDPIVAQRYTLSGIVTTIDAVNGADTLETNPEALRQAVAADTLVVTKTDIAARSDIAGIVRMLAILNPSAQRIDLHADGLAIGAMLDCGADHRVVLGDFSCDAGGHGLGADATALILDAPVTLGAVRNWIDEMRAFQGPDLLRIKGLLPIVERPGRPLAVHAVQKVFHPPQFLDGWPGEDRRGRLEFITRGRAAEAVKTTRSHLQAAPEAAFLSSELGLEPGPPAPIAAP